MLGKTIGPYRIVEQLGASHSGEDYRAYDERLSRWVVIRRIHPDASPEDRERLRRGARASARLSHSAIVHVYDVVEDDGVICLVMEYVDGRRLDEIVARGPMPPDQVVRLGAQIAGGLDVAHRGVRRA